MIDKIKLKQKIEKILEQSIINISEYTIDTNGDCLVIFTFKDEKYNQIIEATLTLNKRIVDNL